MEDHSECQRITRLIVDAMQVSTDPVTAAGAGHLASLELENPAQAIHLARCVAAFTTDDGLANEMAEIVGESPRFLIGKVLSVNYAPVSMPILKNASGRWSMQGAESVRGCCKR